MLNNLTRRHPTIVAVADSIRDPVTRVRETVFAGKADDQAP